MTSESVSSKGGDDAAAVLAEAEEWQRIMALDAEKVLDVYLDIKSPHAYLAVRPSLRRVVIWNRSAEKAGALAERLAFLEVDLEATGDLEAAVRAADVISCATGATAPLIGGAWLQPGSHLDLVGGFMPEMREADDEACRRARIHVDSRWFTLRDCGDIAGPLASGAITEADVLGDLFELCRGEAPGRQNAEEITIFKNAGGGHLDLMTARHIAAQVG